MSEEIQSITSILSGLNIASAFVKGYLDKIKDTAVREKLEELLNAIIPLQSHIISLQSENGTCLQKINSLEAKLREIEIGQKKKPAMNAKKLLLE